MSPMMSISSLINHPTSLPPHFTSFIAACAHTKANSAYYIFNWLMHYGKSLPAILTYSLGSTRLTGGLNPFICAQNALSETNSLPIFIYHLAHVSDQSTNIITVLKSLGKQLHAYLESLLYPKGVNRLDKDRLSQLQSTYISLEKVYYSKPASHKKDWEGRMARLVNDAFTSAVVGGPDHPKTLPRFPTTRSHGIKSCLVEILLRFRRPHPSQATSSPMACLSDRIRLFMTFMSMLRSSDKIGPLANYHSTLIVVYQALYSYLQHMGNASQASGVVRDTDVGYGTARASGG
ncbi:hypothetical protein BJ684DRAFT_21452 [Piptocephalis cylindrospora]|uniref:Uncharacterized protein n=1 Tax=Piptocephalis cylindrospora TaxID=1907219 RepID=A0A4P9XZU3_9FUNG|nr:hypothetical protein BJ684DRAFT_21452 [Piptocephalis cylindrospora]|eukprot:RKP11975.1 hypothetical protein BJ684DRAFT_21452 [Piptocephalis cylindrospora]